MCPCARRWKAVRVIRVIRAGIISATPPLTLVDTTSTVASALCSLLILATILVRFIFLHLSPLPVHIPAAGLAVGGTSRATPLGLPFCYLNRCSVLLPCQGLSSPPAPLVLLSIITVVTTSAALVVRIILLHTVSAIYYLHQYNVPRGSDN